MPKNLAQSTVKRRRFLLGFLGLAMAPTQAFGATSPQNSRLIELLKDMPKGGAYDASPAGTLSMARATSSSKNGMILRPELAKPSYCSGATYLLLLRCLEELGHLKDAKLASLLKIADIPDGTSAWGRWNANGPGAARFCFSTGIGANFESWKSAAPGDFLKIFWNDHIGKKERGHLVLLTDIGRGRDPWVSTWSSHEKMGYGMKKFRKSKIKWAIFSRLQNPERIQRAKRLSKKDKYLAKLLTEPSSKNEVRKKCGMGLTQ